ncbi:MAG: peptidylprolyl isomerase, partial [Deltaproteobacteria bacterium]|nr:peptidylprolyl isomerase [Deltaproteobacteria bacterium]
DETLRKMLAEQGMTLDQYRSKMKEQILRAKLIDYKVKSKIIITKEDIESYYNDHHKEYSGTSKYHLRNIIMKTSDFSEGKQQVFERMETILLRLKQGEAFADLAMTYSESPIAENGGDIGLFKLDDLVNNIRDSVEKIKPGEFTEIIDTDLGYQIFYLEEIVTTEGVTLEKATPSIEEKLYKQELENKFKAWISDLKEEAHIQLIK